MKSALVCMELCAPFSLSAVTDRFYPFNIIKISVRRYMWIIFVLRRCSFGTKVITYCYLHSGERVNFIHSSLNTINTLQKIYIQNSFGSCLVLTHSIYLKNEKHIYVWLIAPKKLESTDFSTTVHYLFHRKKGNGSDKYEWNVYPSSLSVFFFYSAVKYLYHVQKVHWHTYNVKAKPIQCNKNMNLDLDLGLDF